MHPILFQVFGFKVQAFGSLVALGLFCALVVFYLLARRENLSEIESLLISLGAALSGLLGARCLFVLVHTDVYLDSPLEIFQPAKGGYVFYGGFLGGLLFLLVVSRCRRLPLPSLLDLFTPPVFLGLAIGRWGCFLVGDCHGKRAAESFPFAVRFPYSPDSQIPLDLIQVPLHPTQIYLSLNALCIFLVTLYILKRQKRAGQTFCSGLMLYALTRGFLEIYRGDCEARGMLGPLSTSQWISAAVLLLLPIGYTWLKRSRS